MTCILVLGNSSNHDELICAAMMMICYGRVLTSVSAIVVLILFIISIKVNLYFI